MSEVVKVEVPHPFTTTCIVTNDVFSQQECKQFIGIPPLLSPCPPLFLPSLLSPSPPLSSSSLLFNDFYVARLESPLKIDTTTSEDVLRIVERTSLKVSPLLFPSTSFPLLLLLFSLSLLLLSSSLILIIARTKT